MGRKLLTLSKPGEWRNLERIDGIDKQILGTIVAGLQQPIREYKDEEELRAMLAVEIQRLAASYGAREEIEDFVLNEAVEFVITRFKALGIPELSEAFRMAAAGDLPAARLEMFGKFNNKVLGSVLGAYRDFRRTVVARIIETESEVLNREKQKQTATSRKLAFDQVFPKMIAEAKDKIRTWNEVPVFWYEAAKRLGLFEIGKEEAQAVYLEAKELARVQLLSSAASSQVQDEKIKYRNALQQLADGNDIELAKVIARKLVVFRKLIKKEDQKLATK